MIHHKHKCIFIHINKCAGTSVSLALDMLQVHISAELLFSDELYNDKQFTGWRGWESGQRRNEHNWMPLDDVRKFWHDYFKFTVVRNPWERVVSDYYYCQKIGINSADVTFKEEVERTAQDTSRWKSPCLDWITIDGENQMDMVLRFENLQQDFKTLCERLNVTATLEHKNMTEHKHYTEYYDDETKQIVAEKYAKDIEYFGYKFGE